MKGQYNITENDDFWHNKEGFLSTHLNLMFPDINSYKKNELDSFIEILNQFQFIVPKRKLKRKRKAKKRISRILKNPVIKSFPPQTQLSIKKYIEKAKDTYDFYRKKIKKKELSNDLIDNESDEHQVNDNSENKTELFNYN